MFNRPKILVCSDFSASSDRALKVANDLSIKSDGEILLLHVAELGFYLNSSASMISAGDIDKKFKELLHVDLMDKLHEQMKKCEASGKAIVFFETNASKGIDKVIDEYKIDLVVMGDKGATGLEQFLLGSLARKTASSAVVPVLIIKKDGPINKIGALVSSEAEVTNVVNTAQEISQRLTAEMSVISLVPKFLYQDGGNFMECSAPVIISLEEESKKQVLRTKAKINESGLKIKANVIVKESDSIDLSYQLVEILNKEGIQLAVLKKHHKLWLEKFILGSVSSRVIETYKGNILVV